MFAIVLSASDQYIADFGDSGDSWYTVSPWRANAARFDTVEEAKNLLLSLGFRDSSECSRRNAYVVQC